MTELAAAHPSVTKVWADGGYQTSVIQHGARLGIDGEVVQRPKEKGGRAGAGVGVDGVRLADTAAFGPARPVGPRRLDADVNGRRW
ncbi:hypothetical protein ACPB9E_17790 [Streptomyces exfoliatus]|uniref:hypothetical protein n=1 Tax=Streptomyces exfoliatus TaxID=1905 RepID=UPI003C2E179B